LFILNVIYYFKLISLFKLIKKFSFDCLHSNTISLQFFQLLRFTTLILISIIFTKTNLTTSEIGHYELFLFLATFAASFWLQGLTQSFLPLYKQNKTFKNKSNNSPEIFNSFILLSFFNVITIICLLLFKNFLSALLLNKQEIPYFNLLLIYLFFSNPSYLIEYIYLLKHNSIKIYQYGISTFLIQFLLLTIPILLGMSMLYSIYGLIIISVIRFIWLLFLIYKYSELIVSKEFILEYLYLAYPLILSALLGSSAEYFDSFLVLHSFDSATFAVFKYGAKEFPLVLLLANALSNSMIHEFADKNNFQNSLLKLKRKSTQLMHILFPITIILLLSSKWLYPIVFNPNFAKSAHIFNIYLLLIISRLIFPHTILLGQKKSNIILLASIGELIVKLIFSVILIYYFGIVGLAFATVIAYSFQKLIWIIYDSYYLKINISSYISLPIFSFYSLITIFSYLFVSYYL